MTAKQTAELWTYYTVTLQLRDRLIGGWPKNPEVEKAMLRARGLEELILEGTIPTDPAAQEEAKQEAIEKSWVGFKTNPDGVPCLEARNVKAMLNKMGSLAGDC